MKYVQACYCHDLARCLLHDVYRFGAEFSPRCRLPVSLLCSELHSTTMVSCVERGGEGWEGERSTIVTLVNLKPEIRKLCRESMPYRQSIQKLAVDPVM